MKLPRSLLTLLNAASALALLTMGGWLLWQKWQEHRAIRALLAAISSVDPFVFSESTAFAEDPFSEFDQAVEQVIRYRGGEAAVPALIEALRADDRKVRRLAAWALARIGPTAQPAVPTLIEGLTYDSWNMQEHASIALVKIGRGSLPPLIDALQHHDPQLRCGVCQTLGKFGPQAEPAVPALIAALKDPWYVVQEDAFLALIQIGSPAVPALNERLKHDDSDADRYAAWWAETALETIREAESEVGSQNR